MASQASPAMNIQVQWQGKSKIVLCGFSCLAFLDVFLALLFWSVLVNFKAFAMAAAAGKRAFAGGGPRRLSQFFQCQGLSLERSWRAKGRNELREVERNKRLWEKGCVLANSKDRWDREVRGRAQSWEGACHSHCTSVSDLKWLRLFESLWV